MTPLFLENIHIDVCKFSMDIDNDYNVFKGEEELNWMIKATERK